MNAMVLSDNAMSLAIASEAVMDAIALSPVALYVLCKNQNASIAIQDVVQSRRSVISTTLSVNSNLDGDDIGKYFIENSQSTSLYLNNFGLVPKNLETNTICLITGASTYMDDSHLSMNVFYQDTSNIIYDNRSFNTRGVSFRGFSAQIVLSEAQTSFIEGYVNYTEYYPVSGR